MPLVVVEITPPDPSPALASVLVDACSSSVRSGSCTLSTSADRAAVVATVHWDAAEARVAVKVVMLNEGEADSRERELQFVEADERVERWRAVGLTIATLVGETRAEPPTQSRQPTAPSSVRATKIAPGPDHAHPVRREARDALWADAGAASGPGLSEGGPRFGAWAGIGWRPTEGRWFVRGGGSYAVRPDDAREVSIQWATLQAGAGAILGSRGVGPRLEPRISISADHVRASIAEPAAGGPEDSASHWGFGMHLAADFIWNLGWLSPLIGLDGWRNDAAHRVLVRRHPVGIASASGWCAQLGARFVLE